MLLEIKNVKKDYKLKGGSVFNALRGVSASFDKGELVSIIGESGSGKSTLMNLIGGLDLDFDGEINLNGKDIGKFSEKEIDKYRKNKIGFVFQSFNLIPHLSVLDNVTIACILSNVNKSERIKRATKILNEVGLKEHLNKKPNQLSGGQMQRVAISRALINNPDIILADEPTGALDSKTSEQMLAIIKKIASEGKLVIMVTHSEKVAKISDRVITISDGLIINDEVKKKNIFLEDENITIEKDKQNLSLFSSVKLAFNNMLEKKSRNILISLGASIGIMAVVLMLSLGNGVENYMTNTMEGYVNPLVVEVNKKSENKGSNIPAPGGGALLSELIPFEDEEIDVLKKIKNVKSLEVGYSITSLTGNKVMVGDKKADITILKTVSSNITSENISKGELPKENEILLDVNTLSTLGNDDLIGELVKLEVTIGKKVISKEMVVSGIYSSSSNSMGNMNMVFINYSDLVKMGEDNDYGVKPTTIYLITENEDFTNDIKEKTIEMGYKGSTQEQMLDMFTEMIGIVSYVLAAVSGISLIVSAIMILVVLYISVVERTKEIGVLKSIGARRKDIKRIFTSEALLIGISSGTIGVVTAYIFGIIINEIVVRMYGIEVVSVSLVYALLGITLSVIVSVIAGLFPASKAAKLDPVVALRRD